MRPASQFKDERSGTHRLQFFQCVRNRRLNEARTVSPEFFIQCLQLLDKVGNMLSGIGATGGCAKMGPASERSVGINGAAPISAEQGTGSVFSWHDFLAATGPDARSRIGCFAFSKHGCFPRQEKLAAFRAHRAGSIQDALAEFPVKPGNLSMG